MPIYVLLLRNDHRGAMQMLVAGAAGAEDQKAEIEAFEGRLRERFDVAGRFDSVLIAEFPDDDACLAFSLAATSHGQYAEVLKAFEEGTLDQARQRYIRAAQTLAGPDLIGEVPAGSEQDPADHGAP